MPKKTSTYLGILSGASWATGINTLNPTPTPVFITYSFPTVMPVDDRKSWPDRKKEWRPFSRKDKLDAKAALKQWGDASGITFLEAKADHGDIQFSWLPSNADHSAFAYFPSPYSPYNDPDDYTYFYESSGNVYLNTYYKSIFKEDKVFKKYILLHEIGHALGLKHSFSKSSYNKLVMNKKYDKVKHTVMAYTSADDHDPKKLGKFDLKAIRALYGSGKADGTQVESWSWNRHAEILTLNGKAGADRIQGTGSKDRISGGAGNDRLLGLSGDDLLSGGAGADVLIGGSGRDVFSFDVAPTGEVDFISDFDIEYDHVQLSRAAFTALGSSGPLAENAFERSGKATLATTRILFDYGYSGGIFYDPDGSGPAASVQIAKLYHSVININAGHFLVI